MAAPPPAGRPAAARSPLVKAGVGAGSREAHIAYAGSSQRDADTAHLIALLAPPPLLTPSPPTIVLPPQ